LNIKDPDIAEKMNDRLLAEVKNKEDLQDLETLYLNHRLRMASDLDLFTELELHLDEENKQIEAKSEQMSKLSSTMSQQSKLIARKDRLILSHSENIHKDDYEGFQERVKAPETVSELKRDRFHSVDTLDGDILIECQEHAGVTSRLEDYEEGGNLAFE